MINIKDTMVLTKNAIHCKVLAITNYYQIAIIKVSYLTTTKYNGIFLVS